MQGVAERAENTPDGINQTPLPVTRTPTFVQQQTAILCQSGPPEQKKGAGISADVKMKMCCDAACGIEYLHVISVMHRDISARNCLYSGAALKLSDFGLSKKGTHYQMVPTERTPIRWTAPEIFLTGIYTPKADVWAFGILMWEIFTNVQEEPYRGWNGDKVRAEVGRGFRLRLPDSAPPKAKEVFSQVMMGKPETRPAIVIIARQLQAAVGRYMQRSMQCALAKTDIT
ncbi:putative tyrosine-protein kinase kin-31 [Toxocara canis]|uniref:Putative tyrosine-protein kinase kin-31 n=1 Tax=Toxocara canis TaxID=6265 RepID=A0A0B2VHU0_TOXCA|nr:putative tyrosine-protein kinase kin-31 [Toxocara canis]